MTAADEPTPTVWMRHPTLPDNPPVEQPRTAFEAVWSHQHWYEVEPPAESDAESGVDEPSPKKHTKTAQKGKE